MRPADNRHSRIVAAARIVLPLAALGLFATLFLFSRQIDPNRAIPLSDIDVETVAREARIGAPVYSGMTADGAALRLEATAARPDPALAGRMTAADMRLRIEAADGGVTTLRSDGGVFDTASGGLLLDGAVEILTGDGWRILSDRLEGSARSGRLTSPGPVQATGPGGRIDAGSMTVGGAPGTDGNEDVVFSGGVKLLYRPG